MTHHQLEVEGRPFTLEPQPIRASLTDSPAMLWGFEVRVLSGETPVCIKTCFVGRVSVQFRDASAPDGPIEALLPVLHELAYEKIEKRIREGELDDEIIFA